MNNDVNYYYSFDNISGRKIISEMDYQQHMKRMNYLYRNRFDGDITRNMQFILKNPKSMDDHLAMMGMDLGSFLAFAVQACPKIFNKRMIAFISKTYDVGKKRANYG